MVLEKEKKTELIQKFGSHEKDTGSTEVQIALLTNRIEYLTEHFNIKSNDEALSDEKKFEFDVW